MKRFRLIRSLGSGAGGEVFLAEDRAQGGRRVALKRWAGAMRDVERAALEREFSTLAVLSLPGVARVFDFGVERVPGVGHVAFFTRAFVEGIPLDAAADHLPHVARVLLFARAAQRVRGLHRAGVVHGDLKPANIVIDPAGDAHVIDFGLAANSLVAASESGVGGTPAFMAPELFQGERPSVLTDVYALGCTLWLLLTGSLPPLERRTGRTRRSDVPPPPHEDPLVQRALGVAARACALDVAQRFPTVGEFLAALERAIEQPLTTSTEWVAPSARGHVAFVDGVCTRVAERAQGGSVLLHGEPGAGKTAVLRAVKWHFQLRGWTVLELAHGQSNTTSPLASLVDQARLMSDADTSAVHADARGWMSQLTDAIAALDSAEPVVVLVDDLDRREPVVADMLRQCVHNDRAIPIVVLATAATINTCVSQLCVDHTLRVPTLDLPDVRTLIDQGLGPVDETVVSALAAMSRGVPGRLIPALRSLSTLVAPTAADVAALDVDGLAAHHWRSVANALSPTQVRIVVAAELLGSDGALCLSPDWLEVGPESVEGALDSLLQRELVRREQAGVVLLDSRLGAAARERLGANGLTELARRWAEKPAFEALDVVARARVAVAAHDRERSAHTVLLAVEALRHARGFLAAAALVTQWLPLTTGASAVNALCMLADLHHDAGDLERARLASEQVLAHAAAAPEQRAQAHVWVARSLSTQGDFDGALDALRAIGTEVGRGTQARALREMAKVNLLRGNYEAVAVNARRGLEIVEASDPVRVELLTSLGMAASYRGDQQLARQNYAEALALARQLSSPRDVANALAYLAIASMRAGDVRAARDQFAECLELARGLGDVSGMATFCLNLGAMDFFLGNVGAAVSSYASSIKLAERAGRANTALQARNNLALAHIYFGLFEQAQSEALQVMQDAQRSGLRMIQAQATVLLGDLRARAGDVDAALSRYDEAQRIYTELEQNREVADVHLDAAEAILERGGPADASAAVTRLAAARGLIQAHGLTDYELRLASLVCRARIQSGEPESALTELQGVVERARQSSARDVLWQALVTSATGHAALGAAFQARRALQEAVEVLEQIAQQVPREHREAFWNDPRRREVRRRAALHTSSAASEHVIDLRRDRLLENIKRLASEHDLDRLLERITDSAVELSGAERGFVLLVDPDGKLAVKTERSVDAQRVDPHAAFSRSIAEAVLIDGEAIVTVDAANDRRVNEFMSVHRLMLRSLACLPIRSQQRTVGVLYLEHRRHRGCFGEADMDVLHALADQAAIALENARLLADNIARQRALEASHAALEAAKREIEALLVARTEELEEARIALDAARAAPLLEVNRHGMIGRSGTMRRVFETIDRLTVNDVPVTIVGESGTGKELVARAIHRSGTRSAAPFVVVNCAAIPESLIESELFGHVRGAFTGADRDKQGLVARAAGGTLFLDEVSEMSPKMQVDLLRVVQERTMRPVGGEQDLPVDVRFVCASNRSLEEMVESKLFREDLYYRLNVVQLRVPALRERREDIPLLCEHFLRSFAKRDGKPAKRLSTEAIERLCAHRLPGNVRQLEHLLLNAWVLVDGPVIRAEHLALEGAAMASAFVEAEAVTASTPPAVSNLEEHREHERRKILESLERHAWNRVQAAAALGMPRRTFYRRLRDYSII